MENIMQELNLSDIEQVSGGRISADAGWGGSLGVSSALLGIGAAVTAPVWGTAALIGGSIIVSGLAIYYAVWYE